MRQSEYKSKIVVYLKKNLKKGYPLESLKWALVNQGYSRTLIDISIKEAKDELAREKDSQQSQNEKPVITHEIIEDEQAPKKSWWKRFFGLN